MRGSLLVFALAVSAFSQGIQTEPFIEDFSKLLAVKHTGTSEVLRRYTVVGSQWQWQTIATFDPGRSIEDLRHIGPNKYLLTSRKNNVAYVTTCISGTVTHTILESTLLPSAQQGSDYFLHANYPPFVLSVYDSSFNSVAPLNSPPGVGKTDCTTIGSNELFYRLGQNLMRMSISKTASSGYVLSQLFQKPIPGNGMVAGTLSAGANGRAFYLSAAQDPELMEVYRVGSSFKYVNHKRPPNVHFFFNPVRVTQDVVALAGADIGSSFGYFLFTYNFKSKNWYRMKVNTWFGSPPRSGRIFGGSGYVTYLDGNQIVRLSVSNTAKVTLVSLIPPP